MFSHKNTHNRKKAAQNNHAFRQMIADKIVLFLLAALFLNLNSCKKLVTVANPINTIQSAAAFGTDNEANAAVGGMYAYMIQGGRTFSNCLMTICGGLSSDEFIDFAGSSDQDGYQFNTNTLQSNNGFIANNLWTNSYFTIYQANSTIQGLKAYTGVHDSVKTELIAEATFLRAFSYFYLVNLFGDVPLALTIDYNQTASMSRTSQANVYKQIIADLKLAEGSLKNDYSYILASGERIIPNKSAAAALLARVYLYTGDYINAMQSATSVINNTSLYSLDSLNAVFKTNSTEAIWQLKLNNNAASRYNITWEGSYFVPTNNTNFFPTYYLSQNLITAFEPNDRRRAIWVDSIVYSGNTLYLPYKYTLGTAQAQPGGSVPQYYMVLRLAEQYLIRAEAEANLGDNYIGQAVADLDSIRIRAALPVYTGPLDKTSVLNAIYHERQVELFAEWGHRWLDLKRTGQAITTLQQNPLHSAISSNMLLYPIPLTELQTDPHLKQNPGYNY